MDAWTGPGAELPGEPLPDVAPGSARPSPYGPPRRPELQQLLVPHDDPYRAWRSGEEAEVASAATRGAATRGAATRGAVRAAAREPEGAGRRSLVVLGGLAVVFAAFVGVAGLLPEPGGAGAALADLGSTLPPGSDATPPPGPVPSSTDLVAEATPLATAPVRTTGPGTVTGVPKAASVTVAGAAAAVSPGAAGAAGPARVGTPVRHGGFEFTVTGTAVTKTVGNELVSTTARGQFLLVSLTVRNPERESLQFTATPQVLYDNKGHPHAVDSIAAVYLEDGGAGYLADVGPGESLAVTLVFDVPAGTTADRIELHDGISSGAAAVRLAR